MRRTSSGRMGMDARFDNDLLGLLAPSILVHTNNRWEGSPETILVGEHAQGRVTRMQKDGPGHGLASLVTHSLQ